MGCARFAGHTTAHASHVSAPTLAGAAAPEGVGAMGSDSAPASDSESDSAMREAATGGAGRNGSGGAYGVVHGALRRLRLGTPAVSGVAAAADPETENDTAPEPGTDSGGDGWRGGGMADEAWAGCGASLKVVARSLRKADAAATESGCNAAHAPARAPDPEI